ncbi:MAG: Xaa-Pro dipeptidase [Thermomicrobiales bacterium]|nr:Xaa-Pro dipeptidase [Thermomicrobiales bacterium]
MLRDKYAYLTTAFRDAMARDNVRAVIAMSPENVLHTAGVYIASQRMIRERLATTVFPLESDPFFVVSSVVAKTARNESWIEDIAVWAEHDSTPVDALVAALRGLGLTSGRIWLEMRYLAATYFQELAAALPDVEWLDAELVLDRTRMVKTPDEIALMQRNGVQAEKAIYAGFMFARAGTTEFEIAHRMRGSLVDLGSDGSPFMSLAAGVAHTLESHAVPGATPLAPGDIVSVDMVGTWRGYYTDMARMAIVGPPSPAQRRAWQGVVEVQRQVTADARPGVKAKDLYASAHRYAREQGFELATNLAGHSLGIGLHEYPPITPTCEEELQPGMTLCIEILASYPDLGRFHVEDLIEVRDGPATRLTDSFDTRDMYVIRG